MLQRSLPSLLAAVAITAACDHAPDAGPPIGQQAADVVLAQETTRVAARVAAGATLASILRAHGISVEEAADLIAKAASVFDVRKIRRDQPYRLEKAVTGALRRFEYEINGDSYLRVARNADAALVAEVLPIPKTRHSDVVRGRISRDAPSLVAAMDAAGETIDLTLAMADIFGGEVDFSTGLQPGDAFQLVVEKQFREGGVFAGYGPIAAAEFVNSGRHVRAVRFTPDGGAPGYYDDRGVSMKRFFLASPLKFQPVITSAFSRSRFHPILREMRPHLGVDYKAPAGAPVVAVSDGVVLSAGMSGGSGNIVRLRHANGFETEYLHLSAIAVRVGAHVHQGDLVGRVGMTGLATGPHLDYRIRKNGAFVNPTTANRGMPPSEPVPPEQMPAFLAVRDGALGALSRTSAAEE